MFQSLLWRFALELVRLVVQRKSAPARGERVRVWGTLVIIGGFAIYTPVRILAQRDEVRFRVHRLGTGPATEAPLRIAFVSDVPWARPGSAARSRSGRCAMAMIW